MRTSRSLPSSIETLELRIAPAGIIVAAGGGLVSVFTDADLDTAHTYETLADKFAPFTGYKGAISVALGDFDGDGNDELITAKAAGKAQVKIWDLTGGGQVGVLLDKFLPFPISTNRGASVAAGDLDGDGKDELIVGAGPGGPANVAIYSDTNSDGKLSDDTKDTLRVFSAPFKGGVKVAAGNVSNTGGDEVVVGMWTNGGTVAVFNDANANRMISDDNGGAATETFSPYGVQFLGGVNVASGPIENAGGGGSEVIVGKGTGTPRVRIFTDTNANGQVGDEPRFDQLKPGGTGAIGAVVAAGDTDESSFFVEVLTGPAAGSGSHVKIFDDDPVDAGSLLSDNAVSFEFDAFGNLTGGLNLAFGKVRNATFAFTGNPQAIPENATLTSTLFIPAGAGTIRDLDISLSIFHTFNGDLDVTLTHVASNISVVLFTDIGGTDEGLIIRLNDEAGTDIGTADNPADGAVSGQFNPEGAALLSAFDGLDFAGEWRLIITDDTAVGADIGTLFAWSLDATV